MATRVHLADDHAMFGEGLESILASRGGVEVVGRSSTGGEDAVDLVGENEPDVVITQIDADLGTARGVLSRAREATPDSRIVVLTMFDNLRYLRALSKLGIDAYVHKSSTADDLVATIGDASRDPGGENVVVSMPRGLPNARIAGELHVAEAPVKRHLANIYEKMGVHSRTEVVRKALLEQRIGLHEITSAGGPGRHERHPASGLFT